MRSSFLIEFKVIWKVSVIDVCEVHVNSAKNQYASSSGVSIKNIEMFTKRKLTLNLGNFFIL